MIAALLGGLATLFPASFLPDSVDLRTTYVKYGLTVCSQNGPLCWDYTLVGLLEYELATQRQTSTRLSPGFLSWAATATDRESDAGSNFGRAYRGLERYGIAPLENGGNPDSRGRGRRPTQETLGIASQLGRVEIHWIRFWNDQEELSREQMQTIQSEIASGHPVAIGLRWPKHTTFAPTGSFVLQVPRRDDIFDGHCVALVGYKNDPTLPGGGAFLFRNSWGERWADGGYAWMPYGLLDFCINDALSVRLLPATTPLKPGVEEVAASQLKITRVAGPTPTTQDMSDRGPTWIGQTQLLFQATKPGQHFGLELPVTKPGNYELRLAVTRAEDNGIFGVSVNGSSPKRPPTVIDGAGPGFSRSEPISCGTFTLKAGKHLIEFTARGKDSASRGLSIGVDAIQLVPVD